MKNVNAFDVLVVYSDGIALSATDKSSESSMPFSFSSGRSNYNDAYAYFLDSCEHLGLTAAFSTSADIIDAGTCKSYWVYEQKHWHKVDGLCYSQQIFDKFAPINRLRELERELLFSSDLIKPFNNPHIFSIFFDKLKSCKELTDFAIPTVAIDSFDKDGITKSIRKLRNLTSKRMVKGDYSHAIVVKDRFGAGGNNIFKITKNFTEEIYKLLQNESSLSFVIQPFMKFAKGFCYRNKTGATDIRLIYQNGKIIQTYIRMAQKNDFRCNEHQGGTLTYITLQDVPKKVLRVSKKIASILNQNNSLFSLDFVISDVGNVFFLEGNVNPGIDWNLDLKKNEQMSKKLIRSIVRELASRVNQMYCENLVENEIDIHIPAISLNTENTEVPSDSIEVPGKIPLLATEAQ